MYPHKLFDYQENMKLQIEKALRLHRSVMAQMPTGTGKTVLCHMPVVATYLNVFFCYSVSLWACQSVSIDTLARFSYGHVSIGGEPQ